MPPPPLAVYYAMVILQWAALPPQGCQHATVTALTTCQLRLAMSQQLLEELRGVLFRPELQQRFASLTHQHAVAILKKTMENESLSIQMADSGNAWLAGFWCHSSPAASV